MYESIERRVVAALIKRMQCNDLEQWPSNFNSRETFIIKNTRQNSMNKNHQKTSRAARSELEIVRRGFGGKGI